MGNKSAKHASSHVNPEEEFKELVALATITGSTWAELEKNLRKHIEKDIKKEWAKLEEISFAQMKSTEQLYPTAITPDNKEKNRYTNILPLETTRVKLAVIEGVDGSDYINANFVNSTRNYICCQAPIKETISDFHRMLWETNASIIVMLTKLCEAGRIKATEYLGPVGEKVQYGDFTVEVLSEDKQPDGSYVTKKFQLTRTGTEEKKTVTQFHYLAWPDGEVPDETHTLHDMLLQVDKLEDEQQTRVPTVVHCSAGIGRTGTYVIINTIIDTLNAAIKKDPNVPPPISLMSTLHELRSMRSGLVNSFEQYKYCYETILNHIATLNNNGKPKEATSEHATPALESSSSSSGTAAPAAEHHEKNHEEKGKKLKTSKKEKKEKKAKKEKDDSKSMSRSSSNSTNTSNTASNSNNNSISDLAPQHASDDQPAEPHDKSRKNTQSE